MSALPKPALSLVVVSFNDLALLQRCLRSIGEQVDSEVPHGETLALSKAAGAAEKVVIEVLIVRSSCSDESRQSAGNLMELLARFPQFRLVQAQPGTTVPQMRALGLMRSGGEIIALVEDDCVLSSGWCANVIAAHRCGYGAVGGSVEPGSFRTGLDWGVFFCEYARFLPPFQGQVQFLPGNNLSYKRKLLAGLFERGAGENGIYEVFVNDWLLRRGERLYAAPDASVTNINSWRLSNATSVPYHHGRGFAAMRFAQGAVQRRLLYSAIAFLLPGIQTLRICKQIFSRRQYRPVLLRALPSILLFWTSWSIGEFMGYLLGPGQSLEQWR